MWNRGLFVRFSGRAWRALVCCAGMTACMGANGQVQVDVIGSPPFCNMVNLTLATTGLACSAGTPAQWTFTNNGGPGGGSGTSLPSSPCQLGRSFGPGCWDVSVSVAGGPVHEFPALFCVEQPQASFTISESLICEGGCVTITSTSTSSGSPIDTWEWAGLPCAEAALGPPSFGCCLPAGTYTPQLTVYANGCPATEINGGTIVVSDNYPTAYITPSSVLDCPGPLAINLSTGSSFASTTWAVVDGNGNTACTGTSSTLTCAELEDGGYEAHLTVTNAAGCSDDTSIPITIFDEPTLTISVNPSPTCAGVCAALEAIATPAPAQSITWAVVDADGNPMSAPPSGPSVPCYTFPAEGTYTVTATATYSGTCSTSAPVQVEVHAPLVADFAPGSDTTFCAPFCIDFTNQSSGAGALSHVWRVNGSPASTAPNPSLCFSATSTVTLEVTNDMGCTASRTITVMIDPPELMLTNIINGCAGVDICPGYELGIIPGETAVSWEWDFGDGYTSTDEAPCHSYALPGTYTICLTIATQNGCTATACRVVTISPALNADFGPSPQDRCAGDGVYFEADNQDGTNYHWNFNGGECDNSAAPFNINTGSNPFVGVLPNGQGCYDVILTISNNGCAATDTVADAVCFYGPVVLFRATQSCGTPFEVVFEVTCVTDDAVSLEWDFNGDGVIDLSGSAIDPLILNPAWDYSSDGEGAYNVCVTAYHANHPDTCSYTRCRTIYIDDPSANLSPSATTSCPDVCIYFTVDNEPYVVEWAVDFGNNVALQDSAMPDPPFGVDDPLSYYTHWYGSYGPPTTNINASNTTFPGPPFPYAPLCIEYDAAGTYYVTATATNINGCIATDVDTITINIAPDFATFTYAVTDACGPFCVQVTADNVLSAYQWSYRSTWSGAWTGFPGNSPNAQLCLPDVPSYLEIRLSGEQGTCSDARTMVVNIPAMAAASFTISDATPCLGQEVVFTATGQGAIGHGWTITGPAGGVVATGSGTPFLPSPSPFDMPGIYTVCLNVEDAAWGCPASLCQTVEVHVPTPSVDVTLSPSGCFYQVQVCPSQVVPGSTYTYAVRRTYPLPEEVWQLSVNPVTSCATSGFLPYGVYDLEVTVAGPGGWSNCVANDTIEDILSLGDVLGPWTWEPLDTVNCAPYCVWFAVYDPLQTGYEYRWDFGDGSPTVTGAVVEHCYTQPGTYCPGLQVVFPNGCGPYFPCTEPIIVLPYEVDLILDSNPICAGDTAVLTLVPVPPFGLGNATVSTPSSPNSPPTIWDLFPASTTTYTYTATYAQCSATGAVEVVVDPLPTLTADPYGPFCINEGDLSYPNVAALPGDGNGYWTTPPGFPDPMVMGGGCNHVIAYTYADGNGCTNAIDIPFCINDTTLVQWVGDLNICRNAAPLPLMPLVSHAGGSFEVDCGNGWESATAFDPATCPVAYTDCPALVPVRYTYMNANGCTSAIDTTMTVHPAPEPAFFFDPPVVCDGDCVQPTDASMIACGSITGWHWEVEGHGQHDVQDPGCFVFQPAAAWHTVTLSVTSGAGCSVSITDSVFVNPLPTLNADPYGPFCCNDPAPLSLPVVVSTAPPGTGSFTQPPCWSVPGGCCGSSDAITYTYTDPLGCTNSIVIPFAINDTTAVTFDDIHVCIDAVPFCLEPYASLPGGVFDVRYQQNDPWVELPDCFFDPALITPQPTAAFHVPIRYRYTNADSCTSTNYWQVTVHPLPQVGFTAPDVCAYDPLVITNTSTITSGSVDEWQWNITGQPVLIDQHIGPFAYDPDRVAITLTATSDRGCVAQYSDTTTVHPVPVAAFTAPDACQYVEVQFTDQSTIAWDTPPDVIDTWEWDFDSNGTVDGTAQHPAHPYTDWSNGQTITLAVASGSGCRDSTTRTITIHPAPVNSMEFDANCFGESTAIASTSTIPQGSIDSTWWELETAPFTYTGTAITHTFSSSPPFFHPIVLYTESDQGCITVTDIIIEIWPLPDVAFTASVPELCVHDTLALTDGSTIPGPYTLAHWQWHVDGRPYSTGRDTAVVFTEAGTYGVELTVTSANGCTASLFMDSLVTVHPLPVAGFFPHPARTPIYDPVIQFTDTSQGAVQWHYHFGDGGHSSARHPQHAYATFGEYLVEQVVTSVHGCLDTAWHMVIVDPDLLIHVPNAFTPNGDGINDVFLPSLDGFAVREYNLTIWDRWGEMIFETDDERQAWNGLLGGTLVQDGVYIWQIELRTPQFTGRKRLRGHVTLLR